MKFHEISNFLMFIKFGVPDKTQEKRRLLPGCPPPSWRRGFGGRSRTSGRSPENEIKLLYFSWKWRLKSEKTSRADLPWRPYISELRTILSARPQLIHRSVISQEIGDIERVHWNEMKPHTLLHHYYSWTNASLLAVLIPFRKRWNRAIQDLTNGPETMPRFIDNGGLAWKRNRGQDKLLISSKDVKKSTMSCKNV